MNDSSFKFSISGNGSSFQESLPDKMTPNLDFSPKRRYVAWQKLSSNDKIGKGAIRSWTANHRSVKYWFIITILAILCIYTILVRVSQIEGLFHQSLSGFCLKYLSKSSYFEFSIFLYLSARPNKLIVPELSPEIMAEPSLFQMHLFWAFLLTFSWATGN